MTNHGWRGFFAFILLLVGASAKLEAGDEVAWKHHNLEFSVTPAFTYHFVSWPSRDLPYKYSVNALYRPFAGFNIGVAYVYRPIKWLGFSAGLNSLAYGTHMNTTLTFLDQGSGNVITGQIKGYQFKGYAGIPVLVHGFVQIAHTVLELTTGPEFLLPVFFAQHESTTYNPGSPGQYIVNSNFSNGNDAIDIQGNSTLAWNLQLTATVPVKGKFELAIGPEMKFLDICPLPRGPYYNQIPHDIDFYIGAKIGFRIGSNFYKKRGEGDQLYRASL
jgi:hypothetical protein